jgi:hypothetical protein
VNPDKPSEAVLRVEWSAYTPGILAGIGVLSLTVWVAFALGWIGG